MQTTILDDQETAGVVPELIARIGALGDAVHIVSERVRRIGRQAIVFEGRSVNIVRPGFGVHVHDAAGSAAVFRTKIVGDDTEFLDGILRN